MSRLLTPLPFYSKLFSANGPAQVQDCKDPPSDNAHVTEAVRTLALEPGRLGS